MTSLQQVATSPSQGTDTHELAAGDCEKRKGSDAVTWGPQDAATVGWIFANGTSRMYTGGRARSSRAHVQEWCWTGEVPYIKHVTWFTWQWATLATLTATISSLPYVHGDFTPGAQGLPAHPPSHHPCCVQIFTLKLFAKRILINLLCFSGFQTYF